MDMIILGEKLCKPVPSCPCGEMALYCEWCKRLVCMKHLEPDKETKKWRCKERVYLFERGKQEFQRCSM